jgi:hypothetical protein
MLFCCHCKLAIKCLTFYGGGLKLYMYVLEGHWHGVFSMDVQKFKWVLTIG